MVRTTTKDRAVTASTECSQHHIKNLGSPNRIFSPNESQHERFTPDVIKPIQTKTVSLVEQKTNIQAPTVTQNLLETNSPFAGSPAQNYLLNVMNEEGMTKVAHKNAAELCEEAARQKLMQLKGNDISDEDFDDESEDLDMEADKYAPPPLHYCKKCDIVQNYRTRHCKSCDLCVAKFDHHCFWIGGCIGELNHHKFWWMLLVMTIQYSFALSYVILQSNYQIWSGLDYNSDNYEKDNNIEDIKYSKEYGAFFMSGVIVFLSLGMVVSLWLIQTLLLFYHTYLLATNQSTWENVSSHKIDYIRAYPSGFLPFNKGLLRNLSAACLGNNKLQKWELPDIRTAWEAPKQSWWDNEKYSCC